ncbi:hypothetical protein EOD39_8157 [Acipenser ruthenus]|uniref:Uncharacterized protein n=1 Tax=Acipenser ruthenus TaxID=7906 RepID=A0A444U4Q0_ACIRT|nr:hypothetical protein EOD39_8157 [Acipenser ruthenus]
MKFTHLVMAALLIAALCSQTLGSMLTINLYQNGTIVVQGSVASLVGFEEIFITLKNMAETEKLKPQNKEKSKDEQQATEMSLPAPDNTDSIESTAPADTDREPPCPAPPQERHSTVSQLRESLALLVEIRELVLTRLSDNDPPTQQLRDQLTQVKNEYKALFRELRAEVKEIQQDRETLKRELAGVREEMQQRERRHTAPSSSNSMGSTVNQTAEKPCRETAPHTPTTPARHADTPTHSADLTHSENTQSDTGQKPEPVPEAAPTPSSRQQHHAEVALLIDSNGKFISEQRLFPGRKHPVAPYTGMDQPTKTCQRNGAKLQY